MRRHRSFPFWIVAGLLSVLVLGSGSGTALADTGRVLASSANLRAAAGVNSRVVASLPRGTQVEVLASSGDWLKVRVQESGTEGFILKRLVEVVAAPAAAPPAPAPAEPAPKPAEPPVRIQHNAVDCVVAEAHPKFQACFRPEENLGRARVLFRAVGTDPWYYVDMTREGECHEAILPKPRKKTAAFQYFVHSLDRSFLQAQAPETAPDHAFAPRVVRNERECQAGRALAVIVGKLAKPIKVGIALDPSGGALAAAAAGQPASMPLTGFSTEGLELGGQAGSAARSGESTSQSGAQSAGGIPKVALVAGGVAAAGVAVAVAAGGGGSDPGSGGSGSGGGGGGGGAGGGGSGLSVAGTWVGRADQGAGLTYQFSDAGISCSFRYDVTFNLSQSGPSVTGSALIGGVNFSCNVPGIGQEIINQALAGVPRENNSYPVTGTANEGGAATLTIAGLPFTGTYSRTNMELNGNSASSPGVPSLVMNIKVNRAS